ncbi:adenylate cyclase, partial [Thalassiosira pseudonana CCMP1335]
HGEDDEPIAELFLDTSIMFSDIVGFTKWSSERSPNEVFKLLERLFWKFDEIAERQNIFKLGTIGDCYIAVTGIPDPIDDHATVLTQFAFDCRQKVEEVCAELDAEGLDTSKLSMRFGIHSGAITAGILRGTKSRFELFGDTINTASRMESTGRAGLIQVSEETAELIRLDRKEKWLHKRDELITAKGKGKMQTYWVEPGRDGNRVSFLDAVDDSLTEAKILRMSEETSSSDKYYNQYRDSEYDEEKTEETPDNGFDVIVEVNNAEAEDEEKQTEQKPSEAFKIPTDDNV